MDRLDYPPREQVFLDDLEDQIKEEDTGAKDLWDWLYRDSVVELLQTGHAETRIRGTLYHLHLTIERETPPKRGEPGDEA